MTAYKITPALSKVTTGFTEIAFVEDTAAADSLTVDAGAYLISRGALARAVFLGDLGGAWTVTINGSVVSEQFRGIELQLTGGTSKLTIGADGSVSAEDEALFISGSGGTAITNNGSIVRSTPGNAILDSTGVSNDSVTNKGYIQGYLALGGGNNTLTNSGQIIGNYTGGAGTDKITNTGFIFGDVDLGSGVNSLSNAKTGQIFGNIVGGAGNDTVTNAGRVTSLVDLGGGTNKITNAAGAEVGGYVGGSGADSVMNSGDGGGIQLGGGSNILKNNKTGTIESLQGGAGNDVITNAGLIEQFVFLFDGVNKLVNQGTIATSVTGGDDADTITNSGEIGNLVELLNGANTLINSGTIGGLTSGGVTGGDDADTVTNSGTIFEVSLGDGSDKLTNMGTIIEIVDLGAGDDTYIGGNNVDQVADGAGSDNLKLGGGDDSYLATSGAGDGFDTIDGGAGVDLYDAVFSAASVTINLDTVDHELGNVFPGLVGIGAIAAKSAFGLEVGEDTVIGIEDARGGNAGDIIYGSTAANVLEGSGGADFLLGFAGNDVLIGGIGDDILWGGTGRDFFYGGTGADDFVFNAIAESGITAATRDVIGEVEGTSFQSGLDQIWLTLIDAIAGGSDDAFTYINVDSSVTPAATFTGTAGELRSYWSANGHIFEGDVNGDSKADFSFEVIDRTHAITFTAADFEL